MGVFGRCVEAKRGSLHPRNALLIADTSSARGAKSHGRLAAQDHRCLTCYLRSTPVGLFKTFFSSLYYCCFWFFFFSYVCSDETRVVTTLTPSQPHFTSIFCCNISSSFRFQLFTQSNLIHLASSTLEFIDYSF